MKTFLLEKQSILPRDVLFKLSTDVANFEKVLPKYFKSLKIINETPTEKLVLENISFLRKTLEVKTKHDIIHPNIHEIRILTGPLRGTSFYEDYEPSSIGTSIRIKVNVKLNGILKFIPFLNNILFRKMNSVMDEFIIASENYAKIHSLH